MGRPLTAPLLPLKNIISLVNIVHSYSTKANHHLSTQFSIQWVLMIFEKVVIGKKDFNGFLNFSSKT
jgi:hypothetical protein